VKVPALLPLVEPGRPRPPVPWAHPWRWIRWLGTGVLSAATPLPWLVDVTSSRTTRLERQVNHLEARVAALERAHARAGEGAFVKAMERGLPTMGADLKDTR